MKNNKAKALKDKRIGWIVNERKTQSVYQNFLHIFIPTIRTMHFYINQ